MSEFVDEYGRQWIEIDPALTFVATLYSDKIHMRRRDTDTTLCGRTYDNHLDPPGDAVDYPAKAMPVEELCGSCVRLYRARS